MAKRAGKKNKVEIPSDWKRFPKEYGSYASYWYWPKGLAVNIKSLKPRLQILKTFEHGTAWRDQQAQYIAALNDAKVSEAEADWDEGGAPLARMLVQVFRLLGLAWVDSGERVEITKAGNEFLKTNDPDGFLARQMLRYQFWNPAVAGSAHEEIGIFPVPFIYEVLSGLDDAHITTREYELFVARAEAHDEVDVVIEDINDWRELTKEQQDAIVAQCDRYLLGGSKRSSIYNTIKLNRTYAWAAWLLSDLLDKNDDGDLIIAKGAKAKYRKFFASFDGDAAYTEFENPKDWIAYMGDPAVQPSAEAKLDYYVNKGDVKKAVSAKKSQNASTEDVKDLRDMLTKEKAVEDYLAENVDEIGDTIGAKLEFIGRQVSTTVGPIDILCKDKKTGGYVVVELKKGRAADKVFGQVSRYMGYVRTSLAEGKPVRGVIVGREIDDKLIAAKAAHDTDISLMKFTMKFGASLVE